MFRFERKENRVKKHSIILSTILLVFGVGILTPQFAQDVTLNRVIPNAERGVRMVALLRTINTDEHTYRSKYGSFGTWQALLSDDPGYFEKYLSLTGQANAKFAEPPEILPGFNLRLNVHTEGQGYDILLEDTASKTGYAVQSDERTAIRECWPLH